MENGKIRVVNIEFEILIRINGNILIILIKLHLIGQKEFSGGKPAIIKLANCIYVTEMRLY